LRGGDDARHWPAVAGQQVQRPEEVELLPGLPELDDMYSRERGTNRRARLLVLRVIFVVLFFRALAVASGEGYAAARTLCSAVRLRGIQGRPRDPYSALRLFLPSFHGQRRHGARRPHGRVQ
jgi:hypothetical protein